jgi:peptidoglycan/xylan/chitin deacetylase (PgdA/CDA1 family)
MRDFLDTMRRRAGRYLGVRSADVRPGRGVLSLSFDDFPASAWTEAGPVLAEHGVKATYFVCGGFEGGSNLDRPQFTTEHLQALHADGHEVGCHTFSHLSTLRSDAGALHADLKRNAAWVAERLDGHGMTIFAYPYGDCALTAKAVVDSRFACARGVQNGVNVGRSDRILLRAIGLESRRLPGYDLEAMVHEAATRPGWLIAYGHDVSDRPTPYGCRPKDLDRLIRLAKSAGLEIRPVGEAWGAVSA